MTSREGLQKQDTVPPTPHLGAARVRGSGKREENLQGTQECYRTKGKREKSDEDLEVQRMRKRSVKNLKCFISFFGLIMPISPEGTFGTVKVQKGIVQN